MRLRPTSAANCCPAVVPCVMLMLVPASRPMEAVISFNEVVSAEPGINNPGSAETTSLKEITASMGRDAGTSISITQSTTAGQQLAADVGRSLIQGTSQYVSKKLRTTKVLSL